MMNFATTRTFRSLNNYNYKLWIGGALISNIGTWMQRTAQDWIVLTQLTHHNATAVGVVMALQFGPQLLLLPWTGFAADNMDRRRLLLITQGIMCGLAVGLGLLTITGFVQLWHVYLFAFLLGCAAAFDAPARQTFVAELVGEGDLSNAVALNSTSFNLGRMIGPAIAGVLIACVGSGWVFLINGASFVAVIVSLLTLRTGALHSSTRATKTRGSLVRGFSYVWKRPDLSIIMLMFFFVGTFGLNFPIFISTMSVKTFHGGSAQYGLLTSIMAVGSVTGALLSARKSQPTLPLLIGAAALFGGGFSLAAGTANYWLFGITLAIIGISAQTFSTTAISMVQLSTDSTMRGRVMAIFLAIALGSTPIGAPFVGWIADRFGPRLALLVGAAAGFCSAIVGVWYLIKHRNLSVQVNAGRLHLSVDDDKANTIPATASEVIDAL